MRFWVVLSVFFVLSWQSLFGQCKKATVTIAGGTATGELCKQKIKASYGGSYIQEYRKGLWIFTNEDGKLYKKGSFTADNGVTYREGEWHWYNEEGRLFVTITYRRDKPVSIVAADSGIAGFGQDSMVVFAPDSAHIDIRITENKKVFFYRDVKLGFEQEIKYAQHGSEPLKPRPVAGIIGINQEGLGNAANNNSGGIAKPNEIWKDGKILALFPGLKSWVAQPVPNAADPLNLVVNPQFNLEKKDESSGQFYFYSGMANGWGIANESPDYFREFGEQFLGFRAAGSNYEVIRGTLKKPLEAGKQYCFGFQVKLRAVNNYAVNLIGAYFYPRQIGVPTRSYLAGNGNMVRSDYNTPVALRDSWMTIQGSFTARGDERFVYIGQFGSRDSTRFWPLDSIFNGATNGEIYYYFRNPVLLEKTAGNNCPCNTGECVQDSLFTENEAQAEVVFVLRDVQFNTGSAKLLETAFGALDSLAEQLLENRNMRLEIVGHTDNQGTPASNIKLSEKRAKAVLDYLIQKGVPVVAMSFKGKGDTEPIEDNETEEGRMLNRRVEFRLKR